MTLEETFRSAIQNQKNNNIIVAINLYQEVLKLDPNHLNAHNNLALIYQNLGEIQKAKNLFEEAIKIDPNCANFYNNLSAILIVEKDYDKAETNLKKAIELKPVYINAYNNLGIVLNKLNRPEEAKTYFDKALKIDPDFKQALINRGQSLFHKGEYELSLIDFDKCNTKESRSRSLTSLYALNRIDEIYKKIETNSELDDSNIATAAFSAFISKKENKPTLHKFCNYPLNFIKISNLSVHLENSILFINEIIEELNKVKKNWEPFGQSTNKGFQSNQHLFEYPSKKLNDLKAIILKEIDSYYSKFKDETCSFITKWPSRKNLSSWCVFLKQQGYQDQHIHTSGWLSGVLYLKVVPTHDKNEGAIEFSLNGENYFHESLPNMVHKPKVGDIILFPSSLHHRTIAFTTDMDRIIISFDLKPNKKLDNGK